MKHPSLRLLAHLSQLVLTGNAGWALLVLNKQLQPGAGLRDAFITRYRGMIEAQLAPFPYRQELVAGATLGSLPDDCAELLRKISRASRAHRNTPPRTVPSLTKEHLAQRAEWGLRRRLAHRQSSPSSLRSSNSRL